MYKIVFFDADGTLLSEIDRRMPQSTIEAIERLIDRGIKVVVATGRPYNLCEEFKKMGIDTIICANGALVKCNDTTIYKSVLRTETVRMVSDFAELNDHALSYFTEKYAMNGKGSENQRIMSALKETLTLTDYPERIGSLSEEIYGMCLYADEVEAQKFVDQFPKLKFKRWHNYVMNVYEDTEASKSSAIIQVLDYYNICRSEAIAFGDGGNDIDMLEYVGLGIAMGNAEQELQDKADFITKKASEDGISHALQYFSVI
ncbi:Cof-type HAD-IIB family hydrolase [Paenibacillus macquariensis]|uniref:Cof subfamily of IIB subfamily of haloacid dehalogenase superfamily/HAD-superfamily hydrolase, subfamily IIB n=1 Tax=Paenibacillus macquariensis TaxID=948756 RepID=A0ABY1JMH9_9BACL|nr:Cof-type HAD-IIB family hydrolase [Paenibacillus macquariensis]MEC0092300.1 Cof-type HAD-IIB family hydrolase [Paenibacillus macquariensis]OAB37157.1 HAD family hydrolase [Paenibacillus macquariensis subsp. macquariensis]SIQ46683.1 Cof subfamily of IIB subfamily of haloacid dehalogenase superfamily/HAD-superfamily hydrolase, subfamily IIB [Paenibacillus macquariensis]